MKNNIVKLIISSLIISLCGIVCGMLPAGILLALHLLCLFVTARDKRNKGQSLKIINMLFWIVPAISLFACGVYLAGVDGVGISSNLIMSGFMGCLFIVIGNYMPKCKQNSTIGVRVPWTLASEENWNATHRFTGKLWVAAGLLFLATMMIKGQWVFYVVMVLVLIVAFVPMGYSYFYYRKQLEKSASTCAACDGGINDGMQKEVKKHGKILAASSIGIIAIIVILLLLPAGFTVNYSEESLDIEAVLCPDISMKYSEITDIEYRKEAVISGNREFGYGTPNLTMGKFKNLEFGRYDRYIYEGCEEAIIIRRGDRVLVINSKTPEETQKMYEIISGERLFFD